MVLIAVRRTGEVVRMILSWVRRGLEWGLFQRAFKKRLIGLKAAACLQAIQG